MLITFSPQFHLGQKILSLKDECCMGLIQLSAEVLRRDAGDHYLLELLEAEQVVCSWAEKQLMEMVE